MLQYDALNSVEIQALRECLDFISNGYRVMFSYTDSEVTYVKLRHVHSSRIISMTIRDNGYSIQDRKGLLKFTDACPDRQLYRVMINSALKCTVEPLGEGLHKKLVFGSELTNV